MSLKKTADGFVRENVVIARLGAMEYLGSEIDVDGLDDKKIYEVWFDEADLFSDETIKSIEGVDVTFIHPDSLEITPDDWKTLACGHVQNIYVDGDFVKGTIFIKDQKTIDEVEQNGIKEVSLGYENIFEIRNGKIFKTNIVANHVAIVPNGRCGSACKIGDSKKVKKMAVKSKKMKMIDRALVGLGKPTRAQSKATRKIGDANKSIIAAKKKIGDSALARLKDAEEIINNPDATDDEKSAAVEAIAAVSEEIQEAVEILIGASDSTEEAAEAVEEIPVGDAEGDVDGAETIAELQEENDELRDRIKELEEDVKSRDEDIKNLREEVERIKGERDESSAVNDAKLRFPKVNFGDAKTGRQAKEAVLVHKRAYTADGVKKLTDCALDSEYSKLNAKKEDETGKKLIGDSASKRLSASKQLGGK